MAPGRPTRACLLAGLLALGLVPCASAARASRPAGSAPVLDQLHPVAVPRGASTPVVAAGKFAVWPVDARADDPGIVLRPAAENGRFTVEVAPGVTPGPYLVRAFNGSGASALRHLVVTTEPPVAESEPNDEVAKAQRLDRLPATVAGRLARNGDVDSYAVTLEAGQALVADLQAHVLGSPVDAVLRLVDAAGRELAVNHDNGRNLDPRLVWLAPSAGTYVVQVFGFAHPATSDVRFAGSDASVYLLHVSRGPQVSHTLPLGVSREGRGAAWLAGWNLGPLAGREVAVDLGSVGPETREVEWRLPGMENTLRLPVGEGPEWLEQTFPVSAGGQSVPFAVTGTIGSAGETDGYRFSATQGRSLVFEVQSASFGFPLDAWVAVRDAAGRELARNDDGAGADPLLEWTAPKDGTYVAAVGSVVRRGAADHLYRLSVRPTRPRLEAVVPDSAFTVVAGKSADVKVTVRRLEGFKGRVTAAAVGLPAGVSARAVEVAEKDKEFTLQLEAAPGAAPAGGTFRIELTSVDGSRPAPVVHSLVATSLNNGVPQGFRDLLIPSTAELWLTVTAAPKAAAPAP